MRKILFAISLLGALTLVLAASAAAPANFAGTWELDKSKSQGLSRGMQGADSVQWTITQDGKQIAIDTKITGGDMADGGGRSRCGAKGPRNVRHLGPQTKQLIGQGKATATAT